MLTKFLKRHRPFHWRLAPGRRIATETVCLRLLNAAGFCLIFGSEDISLPKIYDAATDDAEWWNWKDTLQAKKKAYLARLFGRKATLVSMLMLPYVLADYLSNGGVLAADEEHYYGRLTHGAKRISDYLEAHGPTPADDLRKVLFPGSPAGTRRFHANLFELQTKFKIVTVGLKDKGWGVRILGLFGEWIPETLLEESRRIPAEKASEKIIARYVETAGMIPLREWQRLFGNAEDKEAALDALCREGTLSKVPHRKELWTVSRKTARLPEAKKR